MFLGELRLKVIRSYFETITLDVFFSLALEMLRNLSYNDPKIKREVEKAVGRSYSWTERLRNGGNGSPKLFVLEASKEIADLMNLDNSTNAVNVEIRWNGIIIRFRSLLETYGVIIPFHKLVVFKSEADCYSIFCDHLKLKLKADNKKIHAFFNRVLELKTKQSGTRIEDL